MKLATPNSSPHQINKKRKNGSARKSDGVVDNQKIDLVHSIALNRATLIDKTSARLAVISRAE